MKLTRIDASNKRNNLCFLQLQEINKVTKNLKNHMSKTKLFLNTKRESLLRTNSPIYLILNYRIFAFYLNNFKQTTKAFDFNHTFCFFIFLITKHTCWFQFLLNLKSFKFHTLVISSSVYLVYTPNYKRLFCHLQQIILINFCIYFYSFYFSFLHHF